MLEAVITRGQNEWRLPDLGSNMREEQDAQRANERMKRQFLHLYDPENQDPMEQMFPGIESLRDVGFLRIFRFHFGEPPEEE